MNRREAAVRHREETPVDDVRRVRERLDREASGDIGRMIELSRQAMQQYRDKLGLKPAQMPGSSIRTALKKMGSRRK